VVTKGAIYGHFSSKENLLLSAIETSPIPVIVQELYTFGYACRLSGLGASLCFVAIASGRDSND
jgi:hypothetical protein